MNLIELSYYLQNEEASQQYLREKGVLKTFIQCPYCNSDKIGNIRRDRIKCYKCKREWHQRKGSFLESRHISYSKFIGFLKLYSEETNSIKIAKEIEIERKSSQELFAGLRKILIPEIITADIIFLSQGQLVLRSKNSLRVLPDAYLYIEPKRYKEFGSLYSFLIDAKLTGTKTREAHLLKSFLSYLKMKTISYIGISKRYFWEYLNEIIFKFNNREKDFFELLLDSLNRRRVAENGHLDEGG